MAFAEWAQNNQVSFNDVWFSDETHFHLDALVNKQNVLLLTSENPRMIHEKVRHAPRITLWVAISCHRLLWPIFFQSIVKNECYLSMLPNILCPNFLQPGSIS